MLDLFDLAQKIKVLGGTLGFESVGISDVDLRAHEPKFMAWLAQQFHGEMGYMARYGLNRCRPDAIWPGTLRVISVRLNYFVEGQQSPFTSLASPDQAYISRYALGRDYHKVLRTKLWQFAEQIRVHFPSLKERVFVDTGPLLEKALAEKAGLGWIGKHTNLLHSKAGSWFFLGEILVDIPLPVDRPVNNHCGACRACLDICPTRALVAPYQLDARRCLAYLNIELFGPIPLEFRRAMGNRIYGCDDCQLICPWNRFAQATQVADFIPRHQLDRATLLDLFAWTEVDFQQKLAGSPIYRLGYERWLRNLAVALGNAPFHPTLGAALQDKLGHFGELVDEHIRWALQEQHRKREGVPVQDALAVYAQQQHAHLLHHLQVKRGVHCGTA